MESVRIVEDSSSFFCPSHYAIFSELNYILETVLRRGTKHTTLIFEEYWKKEKKYNNIVSNIIVIRASEQWIITEFSKAAFVSFFYKVLHEFDQIPAMLLHIDLLEFQLL